jgi:hypothetical protein
MHAFCARKTQDCMRVDCRAERKTCRAAAAAPVLSIDSPKKYKEQKRNCKAEARSSTAAAVTGPHVTGLRWRPPGEAPLEHSFFLLARRGAAGRLASAHKRPVPALSACIGHASDDTNVDTKILHCKLLILLSFAAYPPLVVSPYSSRFCGHQLHTPDHTC